MPISHHEFREALATFASGVTVVTAADDDGGLYGLTVSAFCSVSLEPPLVLVCIEKTARCHDAFSDAGRIVINVLAEHQSDISQRFATQLDDKFEGIAHTLSGSGIPIIDGAVCALECTISEALEGGDHTIFVAVVEQAHLWRGAPLIYFEGGYRRIDV